MMHEVHSQSHFQPPTYIASDVKLDDFRFQEDLGNSAVNFDRLHLISDDSIYKCVFSE